MSEEIQGLKETQDYFVRLAQGIKGPSLEKFVAKATLRAHRYTTMIVHVDTGRLKNSLWPRIQTRANEAYGTIGTNVVYAGAEHDRGGSHAFFARTVEEEGPAIIRDFEDDIGKAVQS